MKRVLTITIFLVFAIYLSDYVSAKYQIPGKRLVRDSVEVQRDFAIHLKDKRIEYTHATAQEEECVLSFFPHFGEAPCWYLRRHAQEHIEVDPGPSRPWFDLP